MMSFIARRFGGALLTLFVIITLSFFLVRAAPGGPFSKDRSFPPEVLKNIEAKYDLDKPVVVQYGIYLKRVIFDFDLGPSTRYSDRSVNELVASGLGYSLLIGAGAMAVALLVGLTAGLIASLNHNKKADYVPMSMAMVGIAIPDFVLASILILIFGVWLNWVPILATESWSGFILPWVTLGLIYAATIARLTRGGMLDILNQDFVRTARAKGLPKKLVIFRHTLKGGLLPVVTYMGPAIAGILTGGLVVEMMFNIPGLGRYFIDSALNRDYTLVLGCVIVYSVFIIGMNFVVDLVYGLLDPRVSYD